MQSRAKRLTESLKRKLRESRGRRFNEGSLSWVDNRIIGDMADAARRDDDKNFYKSLEKLGSGFEHWMDTVNGDLADAVQHAMGVSKDSDLYVAMQFLDENGY